MTDCWIHSYVSITRLSSLCVSRETTKRGFTNWAISMSAYSVYKWLFWFSEYVSFLLLYRILLTVSAYVTQKKKKKKGLLSLCKGNLKLQYLSLQAQALQHANHQLRLGGNCLQKCCNKVIFLMYMFSLKHTPHKLFAYIVSSKLLTQYLT